MDIGIVMPVYYQKEEHIRLAIRSILNQTYKDFILYIVIDGAMELLPIVSEEVKDDRRVQIIAYKENKGVAHALNTGFAEIYKNPAIKYTTWVSNDNFYYPFFLRVLHDGIVHSPDNVGIVYTSFNQILDNGDPAHDKEYLIGLHKWQGGSKDQMFEGCIIGPAFIHRVEYCKNIAPYRFTLIQDYDYWLRMMDHCDIKYIPIETMDYRLNSPFSLSTNIQSNPTYHRVCWNEVHLSQWETRMRRGIRPELTIAYYLYDTEEETLKSYGWLLDQYWTNYKLYVISCSSHNNLGKVNEIYFDKRVTFIDGGSNPSGELTKVIQNLDTPYFMFCDSSVTFANQSKLKPLIQMLKENPGCVQVQYGRDHAVRSFATEVPVLQPYTIFRSELIRKRFPA
ncbi:glycosyltransferase [Aneurinibacillus sp. BA2021]|nr:glycosyltransferase [Aneurinibacillus sp. BA2021]